MMSLCINLNYITIHRITTIITIIFVTFLLIFIECNHAKRIIESGDIVGDYRIEERIDYLGYQKLYAIDDHSYHQWARGMKRLTRSPSNNEDNIVDHSDNGDQWTAFPSNSAVEDDSNPLTVLNDIHIDLNHSCIQNGTFCLNAHIFRGGHGDIYRAYHLNRTGHIDVNVSYILKRMSILDRPNIELCAKREIYFGERLSGGDYHYIARYISFFKTITDYWLVFRDEGISLQQLFYAMTVDDSSVQLKPSMAWKRLRTTIEGQASMRTILYKVISNVAVLHREGIVHRDIKLSNILVNTERPNDIRLLLGDFSSAVDDVVLRLGLYGNEGPTRAELTAEYEAPEVRIRPPANRKSSNKQDFTEDDTLRNSEDNSQSDAFDEISTGFDPKNPEAYDIWTVGMLFMEMILATPNVFDVDQRAAALIHQRLKKQRLSEADFEHAYRSTVFMAAMSEYCLYNPQPGDTGSTSMRSNIKADATNRALPDSEINLPPALISNSRSQTIQPQIAFGDNSALLLSEDIHNSLIPTEDKSISRALPSSNSETDSLMLSYMQSIQPVVADSINRHSERKSIYDVQTVVNERSAHKKKFNAFGCDKASFRTALLRRDSLGIGFNDEWGLDLAMKLLQWAPGRRIKMGEALQHAYFVGPYVSYFDGSEHATRAELIAYNDQYRVDVLDNYIVDTNWDGNVENWDESIDLTTQDFESDEFALDLDTDEVLIDEEENNFEGTDPEIVEQDREIVADYNLPQTSIGVGDDDFSLKPSKSLTFVGDKSMEASFTNIFLDEFHIDLTAQPLLSSINQQPDISEFRCPKCGRKFSDWPACIAHVRARKHGSRCSFDASLIPRCISYYWMHPLDPDSGWCDLQGRRRYIEDVHAAAYSDYYRYFGVFDGHFGSRTARIGSKFLHKRFQYHLTSLMTIDSSNNYNFSIDQAVFDVEQDSAQTEMHMHLRIGKLNPHMNWNSITPIAAQDEVVFTIAPSQSNVVGIPTSSRFSNISVTVRDVVNALHRSFLDVDSEVHDTSGSAVALLILFESHLVAANLGDCRVIICCSQGSGQPIQLTVDHTPDDEAERQRVIARGGWVSDGLIKRVNGVLAVTRSLGDKALKQVVSSSADILVVHRVPTSRFPTPQRTNSSGENYDADAPGNYCRHFMAATEWMLEYLHLSPQATSGNRQYFAVVASDGFWDVVSNDEASQLVCMLFLVKLQERASLLVEADLGLELSWLRVNVDPFFIAHTPFRHDSSDHLRIKRNGSMSNAGLRERSTTLFPTDLFQQASMLLAQESWIRGSTDNIGVTVINLIRL